MLSRLGEGGMGAVYLCEHVVLHRKLAVKVLRADLTSDPELVDRFRNEAIAASRIAQENVVDVLDFGTDEDGALYYVMEALEGRSLGTVIRDEGALAVPRALDLLEQICRALAAAHARGVVHRDVKPDNMFLVRREDGTERVKVIDFGISHVPRARGKAPITRVGAIIGTPEYMAPEQAAGATADPRADVYAAGVLAFEMLTGDLPMKAATPVATLVAHQTTTADPPSRLRPEIPPEVDALVLRALAKKPEERHASMEALAAEIARLRRSGVGRPTVAYPPPRPSRPRVETLSLPDEAQAEVRRATLRTRRRARVAGAALAAVALAALGGAWVLAERTREVRAAVAAAAAIRVPRAMPSPIDGATSAALQGAPAPGAEAPLLAPAPVPDAPRAPAAGATEIPATPKKAVRPVRDRAPRDGLKDPYSGGGELKDPFE